MQSKLFTPRFLFILIAILIAAFSRLIPHTFNFSPLCAIGLFGAAYFAKKWQALLIPIVATWLSDLFLNNVVYASYFPSFVWFGEGLILIYGSYLLISIFGLFIFNSKISIMKILAGALGSTAIFFLVSNLGCWYGTTTYSQDTAGLINCYAAGVPFLKGTLLGNLFYTFLLFGSFYFAEKRFPKMVRI